MKLVGILMLNIFTSLTSIMIISKMRKRLDYLNTLIDLAKRIKLLLQSVIPETSEIMKVLSKEYNLKRINDNSYLLTELEKTKYETLFDSLGKYDLDSQLQIINEFIGYFEANKSKYEEYLNTHYKLYLTFGVFGGIALSILLI